MLDRASRRRSALVVALGLGALALWLVARLPAGPGPSRPASEGPPAAGSDVRVAAPAGTPPPARAPAAEEAAALADRATQLGVPAASRAPVPLSLRGTEVDGGLVVDGAGHFVPTPDALRLFDYFFAASGEEPTEVLRGRIVLHLLSELPPVAAEEAVAVLDRYVAYREAARVASVSKAAPADLERRLQWLRELRRAELGPRLAEALYGPEEERVRVDLERRRIAGDEQLSPAERERALEGLQERLPAPVQAARERALAPQRAHHEVEALRREGGAETEVFALREQRFGRAAAERLAALDAERARWHERIEAYRSERERILADEGIPADERAAALARLLDEGFDPLERKRVEALVHGSLP